MKTKRKELLTILEKVAPGLAQKEIIQQSTSFVFQKGHVSTYNDTLAVRHPADIGIEGAVLAKQLHTLLNKTTADEVEFEVVDNELRMKAGRAKAGIKLSAEVYLPLDELGDVKKWHKLPSNFKECLKFCLFSCSSDMSTPQLTCVHVAEDFVESTDNLRITSMTMDASINDDLLIPQAAAKILCNYNPTKYATTNGWIHFECSDKTVFSCRTYALDFPDTTDILEQGGGTEINLPANLSDILDRAEIFSKAEIEVDSSVRITLDDGRVRVRGENEAGWIEEESRTRYKGEPVHFEVTPRFLVDMLDKKTTITINEGTLRFEGKGFIHVVCLLSGE